MMLQAEKERHAEFLKFQTEQAELIREHELKILEVIMKVSNPPKEKKDEEQPQEKSMQPRSLHSQFPQCSNSVYGHIPPLPDRFGQYTHARSNYNPDMLDLDSQNNQSTWY